MNRREKFLRLLSVALIAWLMTASSFLCVVQSLGMTVPWHSVYAAVGIGCVVCLALGYARWSRIGMFALIGIGCALCVAYRPDLLTEAFARLRRLTSQDWDTLLVSTQPFVFPLAVVSAMLMFSMVYERSFLSVAVFLSLGGIVAANALSPQFQLVAALPALLGILLALASGSGLRFRAWIPAILAVAVAFLALPQQAPTWEPLTSAAERVRGIFQDYFRFTKERVPFSIRDLGYNCVRDLNGSAVFCLGGPADPHTDPVMEVDSDGSALLRGSVKAYYSGYSWEDPREKARYLYYDISRRNIRNLVFDIDRADGLEQNAFRNTSASVRMVADGTSTVFVFGRLNAFDLDKSIACHFNSVGEMFLSRNVTIGDFYTMSGDMPVEGSALASAVEQAALREDTQYQDIFSVYTQLPKSVEQGVYALAQNLTQDLRADYEKAVAIEQYLSQHYTYTLTPEYPPLERDFASYFLLTSKEGYCTYFATAMAVLLRALEIPARYVEGYSVPQAGAQTLTGMNAHAWVEVYFKGLGWVSFDPTAAARNHAEQESQTPMSTPTPQPTSAPQPTQQTEDGLYEPTPTPSAQPDWNESLSTPTPNPWENQETPTPDWQDEDTREKDRAWLFLLLLLILIIIALVILWIRRRLDATSPARLADAQETQELAAFVLYRAILTLLACSGQHPLPDEMPEQFAQRIAADSPFVEFARRISRNRYGNQPITDADVRLGFRAYNALYKRMLSRDKFRFRVRRILRGIGNFQQIP